MSSFIHLLPDSIANQIAAGEVVQRPASVVKELMENAIDAGATSVKLLVEDAGKKLIQVIDNGKGMGEADLRMAFERHATSKVNEINDLYKLKTLGFRGEALASIAAVAIVESKTKPSNEELGTRLLIEGSEVKVQEPCSTQEGTSIAVKNLFYNTPARKNFLKSHTVEYRHILEEFIHIALANPQLQLTLKNGNETVYFLKPGKLRQRIINVLGKKFDQGLVPVEESTDMVKIKGFIGKPDFARKKRGDQYFFVNNRYIRSPYLNHAVIKAYEGLLPEGYFPVYALYFEMNPEKIDVNVHPTKTEVKFEDEKSLYAIIKASIKKALSENHIAPSLDFEREPLSELQQNDQSRSKLKFNTMTDPPSPKTANQQKPENKAGQKDWEELFKVLSQETESQQAKTENQSEVQTEDELFDKESKTSKNFLQIQSKYILSPIHSGLMIVHQQYARQRILYEHYQVALQNNSGSCQHQLFPEVVELKPEERQLVNELLPDIKALGFDIESFGKNAFLINGTPADIQVNSAQAIFEQLIEDFQHQQKTEKLEKRDNLARSMAKNAAANHSLVTSNEETTLLIDQLFACQMPYYTPGGKPVFITISNEELDKKFEKPKS